MIMNKLFHALTLAIAMVCLLACDDRSGENQKSQTQIFVGAEVLIMDSTFSEAEAFAIAENKIVAIGSQKEVETKFGGQATIVDLTGKTVMPAFIDPHVHTISAAQNDIFEDVGLTKFDSIEQALNHMIQIGERAKEGDWLLFVNLDFGTQPSSYDKLTAEMLDKVSTELPVFVFHAGGHIASVNSKMIDLMKITKDTPDPDSGGKFGRKTDGQPDGMLYGFAVMSALEVLDPWNQYDIDQGIKKASNHWLSTGIGTMGDAGIGNTGDFEEFEKLSNYAKTESLNVRIRGYLSYSHDKEWDRRGYQANTGDDKVRIVGYKLSADGSNQARTGLQREPYIGTNDYGLAYMSEDALYKYILDKSSKGFQMAIHGNGDAAIDNILSALNRAQDDGATLIRPRIEHCSFVQDDQFEKFKQLGVSGSFLIGHVRLWGTAYKNSVFGLEKSEKLDRTGSFERAGIPYSLHSDAAVTTFSPLEMVQIAVMRETYAEPGYVLAPQERASRKMALRGVTSTAAWQLMSEHEVGSLEVGKLADFVVLDANPMKVSSNQIDQIQVLETWVDGQLKYRKLTD